MTEQTDAQLHLTNATYGVTMSSLDAVSAAAAHVSRNWGDDGYRLGLIKRCGTSVIFGARAGDGSEFFFYVDRWGNVTDIPQATYEEKAATR